MYTRKQKLIKGRMPLKNKFELEISAKRSDCTQSVSKSKRNMANQLTSKLVA